MRRFATVQSFGVALLAGLFIGGTLPRQAALDRQLRAHASLAPLMQSGEHVLGLTFEDLLQRGPERARPFLHATGWVAVERGLADAGNYEAHTDHFQVRLRPGVRLPDPFLLEVRPTRLVIDPFVPRIRYVLARDLDRRAPGYRSHLQRHYREVASAGSTILFERRGD